MINRMLAVFAIVATTLWTPTVPKAQTATPSDESPFGFQLEQTRSPRGLAVEAPQAP